MKKRIWKHVALTTALFACGAATSGELVMVNEALEPANKAAFEVLVKGFEKANPDVKVKVNTLNHKAYTASIRSLLAADAPDLVTGYAGNRMAPLVNAGLFEDVSDLWAKNNLGDAFKSASSALTLQGKKWGVPYTYYQWGIYYRKDIFAKLKIVEPTTWNELLKACETIKRSGVTPFAMGSKDTWTTGGWFDYLNLRVNGYEFHMELTAGKIPFTDKRVHAVFDKWDQLVKPGYYLANHGAYRWEEAVTAFAKGEAAMYLMGNFAVSNMRAAGLKDEQIGFLQFPEITPGIPRAEDAPTDTVHIPAKAKNKADARRFLLYLAKPEVQTEMNRALGLLPVNRHATVSDDPFNKSGFAMLSNAYALAQYYDRDVNSEMAKAGEDSFQRYMLKPSDREAILKYIDQVRVSSYK